MFCSGTQIEKTDKKSEEKTDKKSEEKKQKEEEKKQKEIEKNKKKRQKKKEEEEEKKKKQEKLKNDPRLKETTENRKKARGEYLSTCVGSYRNKHRCYSGEKKLVCCSGACMTCWAVRCSDECFCKWFEKPSCGNIFYSIFCAPVALFSCFLCSSCCAVHDILKLTFVSLTCCCCCKKKN